MLKTFENQGFFKIRPEFTTLLRQMKSSYDKYVVKEVKYDEGKNYENGIDYVLVGDYYIPDLKFPEENGLVESMANAPKY